MSQRNSGYERKEHDRYETPEWVTQALLRHLKIKPGSVIWEPACGTGKMVRALRAAGHFVIPSDISPDMDGAGVADFMRDESFDVPGVTHIITNPPYGRAAQLFIERALDLTEASRGTVAMLLRCNWHHAKTRQHLFGDCPQYVGSIVLTRRIVWFDEPPPGKDKADGPSMNHAWFVWSWRKKPGPAIQVFDYDQGDNEYGQAA